MERVENLDLQDMEDVGEMELEPQPTELELQTGSGGTHAYKVNLWAFAAPN